MLRPRSPNRYSRLIVPGQPINTHHPLAQGLVSLWTVLPQGSGGVYGGSGQVWRDLCRYSGNDGALTNGPLWKDDSPPTGPGGFGSLKFDGTDDYVNCGNGPTLQFSSAITIHIRFKLNSVGLDQVLIAKDKDTGGRAWTLDFHSALRWYINGGAGADLLSGITPTAGVWYDITVAFSGQTLTFYSGGKEVSAAASGSTSINSATANVTIGRRDYSGFESYALANVATVAIYNRNLTRVTGSSAGSGNYLPTALVAEIDAGFPNLLNWVPRRFFGSTAGSSLSITADRGVFTETGNAANLLQGHRLPAVTGAFTETGNVSGLLKTNRLQSNTGVFTEAGYDATLTKQRILPATVGAFVESGSSANLLQEHLVPSITGVFAEIGNVANLLQGHKVSAAIGVFVETGNTVTLTKQSANTLTATTGVFIVTGQAAALTVPHHVLIATVGVFLETGQAATLTVFNPNAPVSPLHAYKGHGPQISCYMTIPRTGSLSPRNSLVVWVRGVLDETDPVNANGTPKFINNATVTWDLIDYETEDPEQALVLGSILASGTAAPMGEGGIYIIQLSHSLGIVGGGTDRYWIHAVVVTQAGYYADVMVKFNSLTRTGNSPNG